MVEVVLWKYRHLLTRRFVFVVLYISLASFNFGYDTGIFASIQGMQSFAKEFGEYRKDLGMYQLPTYLSSIMNSTPFGGKIIGTILTPMFIQRYGRKSAVIAIVVLSVIGTTLQASTTTAAQFAVGRIFCYMMTGVAITVVPTYQSETSPAEVRGAVIALLQFWNSIGQLTGSIITWATAERPDKTAWLIPTVFQYAMPLLLVIGYWFVPESPRWLVWHGRTEEAVKALKYLRPRDSTDEALRYELDLIHAADLDQPEGTWKDLFKGSDLRRTIIACGVMIGQQCTGQGFLSSYQVVFLQSQGITDPSPFLIGIIQTSTGLVFGLAVSVVIDTFGRRPILIVGGMFMAFWIFMVGGLGVMAEHQTLTATQKNTMVACLMLFGKAFGMSWAPLSYVVMGEVPSNKLREKTVLLAASISVFVTFLVNFTLPYLLNPPYADLGPKVGFLYGSLCVATVVWTFFYLPELKNRSLEELDEMFEKGVSVFKFRKYEAEGIGKKIRQLEGDADMEDVKKPMDVEIDHVEHVEHVEKADQPATANIRHDV